jgi:hypothetical protein
VRLCIALDYPSSIEGVPDITVRTPVQTIMIMPSMHMLCVDANRDGLIESPPANAAQPYADEVTVNNPFRFWINDDDDSDDTDGNDIPGNLPYGQTPNLPNYMTSKYDDPQVMPAHRGTGVIDGTRDLVDFFPVFFNIKNILDALPSGADVKCILCRWMTR